MQARARFATIASLCFVMLLGVAAGAMADSNPKYLWEVKVQYWDKDGTIGSAPQAFQYDSLVVVDSWDGVFTPQLLSSDVAGISLGAEVLDDHTFRFFGTAFLDRINPASLSSYGLGAHIAIVVYMRADIAPSRLPAVVTDDVTVCESQNCGAGGAELSVGGWGNLFTTTVPRNSTAGAELRRRSQILTHNNVDYIRFANYSFDNATSFTIDTFMDFGTNGWRTTGRIEFEKTLTLDDGVVDLPVPCSFVGSPGDSPQVLFQDTRWRETNEVQVRLTNCATEPRTVALSGLSEPFSIRPGDEVLTLPAGGVGVAHLVFAPMRSTSEVVSWGPNLAELVVASDGCQEVVPVVGNAIPAKIIHFRRVCVGVAPSREAYDCMSNVTRRRGLEAFATEGVAVVYKWESDTGNKDDLVGCVVREFVSDNLPGCAGSSRKFPPPFGLKLNGTCHDCVEPLSANGLAWACAERLIDNHGRDCIVDRPRCGEKYSADPRGYELTQNIEWSAPWMGLSAKNRNPPNTCSEYGDEGLMKSLAQDSAATWVHLYGPVTIKKYIRIERESPLSLLRLRPRCLFRYNVVIEAFGKRSTQYLGSGGSFLPDPQTIEVVKGLEGIEIDGADEVLAGEVFDVAGRRVGDLGKGAALSWDYHSQGRRVPSGIYFLRITSGKEVLVKKIVVAH